MKLCAAVALQAVALLAWAGATLGDDGDEASPDVGSGGRVADQRYGLVTLYGAAFRCVEFSDGTGVDQLKPTSSPEESRAIFKGVCGNTDQIRECLAGVEQESESRLDPTHLNVFKVFFEVVQSTLREGCVHEGREVAHLFTAYFNKSSSTSPFNSDPFRICMTAGVGSLATSVGRDLALSSWFFVVYRELVSVKECFGGITEGDLAASSSIKAMLGRVTETMKCLRPDDGSPVLCSSIDVTLAGTPQVCPLRSEDEEKSPLFGVLMERLSFCLASTYYTEATGLGLLVDLEASRAFVKHYCASKRVVGQCLTDVLALSAACLDEPQSSLVAAVAEGLPRNALEYGCIDDGRDIAYLLFKVVNDQKNSPDVRVVKDCMAEAEKIDGGSPGLLDAAKILTYYRQLGVFKGCFIDKLRGDNKAVFIAQTVLGLLQRSMKCVDPEHGTVVLCETVDHAPSTAAAKVCPFVGEDELEPPGYEVFADQAMSCLKATTPGLDRLDELVTLEEFRAVFGSSICRGRLAFNHCLGDVSSNSAACQNETNHQVLTIFTDFFGAALETGCRQDGEVLAVIMYGFEKSEAQRVFDDSDEQVNVCLDSAGSQFQNATAIHSLPEKTMLAYRAIEAVKQCVLNGSYDGDFKNVFATFVNEIVRSLKCIRPDDGTIALCETIVNNLA